MSRSIVIVYATRLQRVALTVPGIAVEWMRAEVGAQLEALWPEYERPIVLLNQETGEPLAAYYAPASPRNFVTAPASGPSVIELAERRARATRPDFGDLAFEPVAAAARDSV